MSPPRARNHPRPLFFAPAGACSLRSSTLIGYSRIARSCLFNAELAVAARFANHGWTERRSSAPSLSTRLRIPRYAFLIARSRGRSYTDSMIRNFPYFRSIRENRRRSHVTYDVSRAIEIPARMEQEKASKRIALEGIETPPISQLDFQSKATYRIEFRSGRQSS